MKALRVGLIGDYDDSVLAHRMIPPALELAAERLGIAVTPIWIATDTIDDSSRVEEFDALWCVPASPYRSMEGALTAIRFAREQKRPFLGTCGGFQHAVIEYARNVLGWHDADHAETSPDAARAVITELECALVEATETLTLLPGTKLADAYGAGETTEGYRCRYGLNPLFRAALTAGPMRASATDATGAVRAVELDDHPFFVATLFQPERAAGRGIAPPLAVALIGAARKVDTVAN
jgi:CTP synthase (UTP-ammonia lyase)